MPNKLVNLFGLSIPLFIIHGLEEYFKGFYNIDSQVKFMFGPFLNMNNLQSSFLLFQIMLWFLLIVSFLLLKRKGMWGLFTLMGLVYIYELYHFVKAIESGGYYPGVVSAIGFPIIDFFYWKELIKQFRSSSG